MLRKMTVLAMAVGIVAALALPASASANWKHHGDDIVQPRTLGLTGNARFQGGLGGVECQVTSKVTFLPGTTGNVETFVSHPTSDTTNCKGLGGLFACQVHDVTPLAGGSPLSTSNPWEIHTIQVGQTSKIQITVGNITSQLTGGFCPVKHIMLTGGGGTGNITATPNQPNTITSVQLHGNMQAHLQTNNQPNGQSHTETVTVGGTLTIESPNAHTYDI